MKDFVKHLSDSGVARRTAALFAALALVAAVCAPSRIFAASKLTLKIHYQRDSGDYGSWSLWLWPAGADGAAYQFGGADDWGAVCEAEFELADGVDEIGIIARKGDWEAKDVDKDRFLSAANAKDGVLECWLVQDEEQIFYSLADISPAKKIKSAVITGTREITITLGADVSPNVFIMVRGDFEGGSAYATIAGVDFTGRKGVITLVGEIDLGRTYTVEIKDGDEDFEPKTAIATKIFESAEFENKYAYKGDLGAVYSKGGTTFNLWAPTASTVSVVFYEDGYAGKLLGEEVMVRAENGVWRYTRDGDLSGQYYNYRVTVNNQPQIATDPYAKAVGANGIRSMVIDLAATNPDGWDKDKHFLVNNQTDAIIYEIHVRDLSVGKGSGVTNKGKFLAFTETDTKNSKGDSSAFAAIKELGVNYVHLLPSYDYHTVDETKLDSGQFNWGYDPQNYNAPEGSYSTDPYHGEVRVNEFKRMVQSVHSNGLGVIMDVVFNHTYEATGSLFDKVVPGYYYRTDENGKMTNGSGCGNETASERAMMRRYIIDSVVYWATEYHVDGFRFDIMALHDVETMNQVRAALDEIDPRILIYGEGWQAGSSPLKGSEAALKSNANKVDSRIAFFSDDFRDAAKGNVFDKNLKGFVSGSGSAKDVETMKFGVVASIEHPQIKYVLTNAGKAWAKEPTQTVTYVSCHDNYTLWDKLYISTKLDPAKAEDKAELLKMNKLSAAALFTSQGIAFFQAGEEFARTKGGNENSYNSPDSVNALDWERRSEFSDLYGYYKGFISLRKAHPAFRMAAADDIRKNIEFLEIDAKSGVIGYTISNKANGDSWEKIAVLMNGSDTDAEVTLPQKGWVLVANGAKAGTERIGYLKGDTVIVPARTAYVFADGASYGYSANKDENVNGGAADADSDGGSVLSTALMAAGAVLVALGIGGVIWARLRKKG